MESRGKILVNLSALAIFFVCQSSFAVEPRLPIENKTTKASAEETWLGRMAEPLQIKGDEVTLKFGMESRYRLEYRDDFNLIDSSYEDDAVNLFRNRLNLDLAYRPEKEGRLFRFFAEAQAAQSFAESGLNKTGLFVNQIDLRQLSVEIEKPVADIPVKVKVGRQELAYGDERFVGPLNWTNTARVFDAVKIIYNPWQWLQLDTFFSQEVRNEPKIADKTVHDDNFYGLYASYKKIKDHVIDTFLFIRHNSDDSLAGERAGRRGSLKEYTLGNRFKGKKGAGITVRNTHFNLGGGHMMKSRRGLFTRKWVTLLPSK